MPARPHGRGRHLDGHPADPRRRGHRPRPYRRDPRLAYDPSANRWSYLPRAPLPAKLVPTAGLDGPHAASFRRHPERGVGHWTPAGARSSRHPRTRPPSRPAGAAVAPAGRRRRGTPASPASPAESAARAAARSGLFVARGRSASRDEPVAVVPVGRDRGLGRALQEVGCPQRIARSGPGARPPAGAGSAGSAGPVEPRERAPRRDLASEHAADRRRHHGRPVARLPEEVLDLGDERAQPDVGRARRAGGSAPAPR